MCRLVKGNPTKTLLHHDPNYNCHLGHLLLEKNDIVKMPVFWFQVYRSSNLLVSHRKTVGKISP